jgi:predicted dehydrogenase
MNDGLTINGIRHNRQYEFKPAFSKKGVDFYDGGEADPQTREQFTFLGAVLGRNPLTVLPEQAAAVTRILDAVYESAKLGKQVIL